MTQPIIVTPKRILNDWLVKGDPNETAADEIVALVAFGFEVDADEYVLKQGNKVKANYPIQSKRLDAALKKLASNGKVSDKAVAAICDEFLSAAKGSSIYSAADLKALINGKGGINLKALIKLIRLGLTGDELIAAYLDAIGEKGNETVLSTKGKNRRAADKLAAALRKTMSTSRDPDAIKAAADKLQQSVGYKENTGAYYNLIRSATGEIVSLGLIGRKRAEETFIASHAQTLYGQIKAKGIYQVRPTSAAVLARVARIADQAGKKAIRFEVSGQTYLTIVERDKNDDNKWKFVIAGKLVANPQDTYLLADKNDQPVVLHDYTGLNNPPVANQIVLKDGVDRTVHVVGSQLKIKWVDLDRDGKIDFNERSSVKINGKHGLSAALFRTITNGMDAEGTETDAIDLKADMLFFEKVVAGYAKRYGITQEQARELYLKAPHYRNRTAKTAAQTKREVVAWLHGKDLSSADKLKAALKLYCSDPMIATLQSMIKDYGKLNAERVATFLVRIPEAQRLQGLVDLARLEAIFGVKKDNLKGLKPIPRDAQYSKNQLLSWFKGEPISGEGVEAEEPQEEVRTLSPGELKRRDELMRTLDGESAERAEVLYQQGLKEKLLYKGDRLKICGILARKFVHEGKFGKAVKYWSKMKGDEEKVRLLQDMLKDERLPLETAISCWEQVEGLKAKAQLIGPILTRLEKLQTMAGYQRAIDLCLTLASSEGRSLVLKQGSGRATDGGGILDRISKKALKLKLLKGLKGKTYTGDNNSAQGREELLAIANYYMPEKGQVLDPIQALHYLNRAARFSGGGFDKDIFDPMVKILEKWPYTKRNKKPVFGQLEADAAKKVLSAAKLLVEKWQDQIKQKYAYGATHDASKVAKRNKRKGHFGQFTKYKQVIERLDALLRQAGVNVTKRVSKPKLLDKPEASDKQEPVKKGQTCNPRDPSCV